MPSRIGRFALRIADVVTPEARLIILICKLSMGDLTSVCIDQQVMIFNEAMFSLCSQIVGQYCFNLFQDTLLLLNLAM